MVKSLVLMSEKRRILLYWQLCVAEMTLLCFRLLYFSSFWWWIIFVSVSSCQCVELWIVYFVRIFSLQHTYFCVIWVVEHTYFCVMRFSKQGNVVFEREDLLLIKEGISLLMKRVFCFLQREYFASYIEKISLLILWRKKHQSGENAEANAPLCRSYRPKNCIQSSFLYLLSWELLRPSKPSFAFFLREGLAS